MAEATARPRNCYCRDGATHCGTCQVCGKPGHAGHFPGPLPYTGSWCDAHYAVLYDRMEAAEDQTSPYGLRDADRVYLRAPGRRRWVFWRGDSFLMEFRSQWLARYVRSPRTARRGGGRSGGTTRCRRGCRRWN